MPESAASAAVGSATSSVTTSEINKRAPRSASESRQKQQHSTARPGGSESPLDTGEATTGDSGLALSAGGESNSVSGGGAVPAAAAGAAAVGVRKSSSDSGMVATLGAATVQQSTVLPHDPSEPASALASGTIVTSLVAAPVAAVALPAAGVPPAHTPPGSGGGSAHTPPTRSLKEGFLQRIKKQKSTATSSATPSLNQQASKDSDSVAGSPASQRRGGGGPRRASTWRTKWHTSNYLSRNDEFRRLFRDVIAADEVLVDDFVCALQKDILMQGRMYLSRDHLCFHASIFGFETSIAARWENVQAITREKTALLFPNALQVTVLSPSVAASAAAAAPATTTAGAAATTTDGSTASIPTAASTVGGGGGTTSSPATAAPVVGDSKQYFFSSFVRRELTHAVAMKIWQNKLLDGPESSADLRRFVCERYGIDATTGSTMSEDDLDDDDDLDDASESELGKSDAADDTRGREGDVSEVGGSSLDDDLDDLDDKAAANGRRKGAPAAAASDRDDDGGGDDGADEPVECACADHLDTVLIDSVVDVPVAQLFDLMFRDAAPSPYLVTCIAWRQLVDYKQLPWTPTTSATTSITTTATTATTTSSGTVDDGEEKRRAVTYVMPMEGKIGPKTSFTTETQTLERAAPGREYRVGIDVTNAGVPYSDTFYTFLVYCMARVSKRRTRLRVSGGVRYKKSCFGFVKSLIERSAAEGMRTHYARVLETLQDFVASRNAPGGRSSLRRAVASSPKPGSRGHSRRSSMSKTAVSSMRGTSNLSTVTMTSDDGAATDSVDFGGGSSAWTTAATMCANLCSPSRGLNLVIVLLLLVNLFFLVGLYRNSAAAGPGMGSLAESHSAWRSAEHVTRFMRGDLETVEQWRDVLELQHRNHKQELDRLRLAMAASSQLLAKVVGALEEHIVRVPMTAATSQGSSAAGESERVTATSGSCVTDDCQGGGNAALLDAVESLSQLEQELHAKVPL